MGESRTKVINKDDWVCRLEIMQNKTPLIFKVLNRLILVLL